MLLLPDRRNLSFPCGRVVSGHHHHRLLRHRRHHAGHRDHRGEFPENQPERRVPQMQPDEAAGTEFQSRLAEDAERPEQSDEDADDRTAAAQESAMLQTEQEPTTQAAERMVLPEQDANRLEQVKRLRVQQPSALRIGRAPFPPEQELSPLPQFFQVVRPRRGVEKQRAHRAHSHLQPQ